MIDVGDRIKKAIVSRAFRLNFEKVYSLIGQRPFVLAGGALCGDQVNDFDVYPDGKDPFTPLQSQLARMRENPDIEVSLLASTKNSLTLLLPGGQKVQLCSYLKPSVQDLVESFDYSHVQVGIRFNGDHEPPQPRDVYYTDAFVLANVTRQSEYVKSEYPTSSMIRALKYYKRGKMTRRSAAKSLVKAMADMIRRGFKDYADFKDQLDAIDLAMPDCAEASALWTVVCDRNLVKNPVCTEHEE